MQQTLRIPAIMPVYRPDGYYYEPRGAQDNFIEENPIVAATLNNQRFTRNRALTTLFAELEPVKGLRFRTNVGVDFIFDNFNAFRPTVPELRVTNPDGSQETYSTRYNLAGATATSSYAPSYLIENTATYDHLFADKHQVTVLLGQSAQEFNFSNVEAYRTRLPAQRPAGDQHGPHQHPAGQRGHHQPGGPPGQLLWPSELRVCR